jgi:hypothetical protein
MALSLFGSGLPDGIFLKPKIQIWVNFGGPWNRKDWLYSLAIWYMLLPV